MTTLIKDRSGEEVSQKIGIMGVWWFFWLVYILSDAIGDKFFDSSSVPELVNSTVVYMIGSLAAIPAGILIVKLINDLTDKEERLAMLEANDLNVLGEEGATCPDR